MPITRRLFLSAGTLALPALGHAQPPASSLLSGRTVEGDAYSLQQDAGKVVLVFFWSADCAVCRDKLPELRRNFQGWRGKGFQIVAVSTDRQLDAVRDYVRLLDRIVPMTQQFPMLWRGDPVHRDSFGAIPQTPTSFVLDRQARVVHELHGRIPPQLWDEIAELLLL